MFKGLSSSAKIAVLTQLQMECLDDTSLESKYKFPEPEHESSVDVPLQFDPQVPMFVAKAHVEPPRLPIFSGDGKYCLYAQWQY